MVDAAAWRQRAHSMGGSLVSNLEVLAGKDIGSADSPRAGDGDHAGSMLHFVSGSLDLEVCGSLLPSFSSVMPLPWNARTAVRILPLPHHCGYLAQG